MTIAIDHPGPEIRGGLVSKKIFQPFGPQFGLKIRRRPGPTGSPPPPLDPPLLCFTTVLNLSKNIFRGCIPPLWGSGIYRSTQFAVFEAL